MHCSMNKLCSYCYRIIGLMFADLFKLFDCCFVITVCYLLCRDVKSSSFYIC